MIKFNPEVEKLNNKFISECNCVHEESRLEDVVKQMFSNELKCDVYKERYTDGIAMLEQCGGNCNAVLESKLFKKVKKFTRAKFCKTLAQLGCYVNNLKLEKNVRIGIITTNKGVWSGIIPEQTLSGLHKLVSKHNIAPSQTWRIPEIREYIYREVAYNSLYKDVIQLENVNMYNFIHNVKNISVEWKLQ